MATPERDTAVALLDAFAERTGLATATAQRRYLWTDAFAVCTLLGLARSTGERRHCDRALALIDAVHAVLAHHRDDDPRQGWLGGPAGVASESHPTRAGLRIGKPLPERTAGAPADERLEWERDGQYFHYLGKWMHALDQSARALVRADLNLWACELADTAHRAFVQRTVHGRPRMVWKMRTDLSAALVASMGQHDPLDGLVTALQLQRSATVLGTRGQPDLRAAVSDYAAMTVDAELPTADPLGLGGLLMDADRVDQLLRRDAGGAAGAALLERLLSAALEGTRHYARSRELSAPAGQRLAFRELGLALGLASVERMHARTGEGRDGGSDRAQALLDQLAPFASMRATIHRFWLEPAHRAVAAWTAHEDINAVTLAASLAPEGMLALDESPLHG